MTAVDEEHKNVFHNCCFAGEEGLLRFLIQKAGKEYLNILYIVINSTDEMGLTPLYLLCQRGYKAKFDPQHQVTTKYRMNMIEMMIPVGSVNSPDSARWDFVAKQIHYTPLHWLAYWNDTDSIQYLLNVIPAGASEFS